MPTATPLGCRGFSSDLWQLNASGSDDSANKSGQGIQMSRLISMVFGPGELLERGKDCPESLLPSVMDVSPLCQVSGRRVLACICHG